MQKGIGLGEKNGDWMERQASWGGVQDDKCICARQWQAGTLAVVGRTNGEDDEENG